MEPSLKPTLQSTGPVVQVVKESDMRRQHSGYQRIYKMLKISLVIPVFFWVSGLFLPGLKSLDGSTVWYGYFCFVMGAVAWFVSVSYLAWLANIFLFVAVFYWLFMPHKLRMSGYVGLATTGSVFSMLIFAFPKIMPNEGTVIPATVGAGGYLWLAAIFSTLVIAVTGSHYERLLLLANKPNQ